MDMVYRELPMEEAQKRFEEIASPPETISGGGKQPRKRKVVKLIVPKSK